MPLNAAENPGSFETETQIPPEEGYDFRNRKCKMMKNYLHKKTFMQSVIKRMKLVILARKKISTHPLTVLTISVIT